MCVDKVSFLCLMFYIYNQYVSRKIYSIWGSGSSIDALIESCKKYPVDLMVHNNDTCYEVYMSSIFLGSFYGPVFLCSSTVFREENLCL